jgi:hypothetical protein
MTNPALLALAAACAVYHGPAAIKCRHELDRCAEKEIKRKSDEAVKAMTKNFDEWYKRDCENFVMTERAKGHCLNVVYSMTYYYLPINKDDEVNKCAVRRGLYPKRSLYGSY